MTEEQKTALATIKVALNKATKEGIFENLDETYQIATAYNILVLSFDQPESAGPVTNE